MPPHFVTRPTTTTTTTPPHYVKCVFVVSCKLGTRICIAQPRKKPIPAELCFSVVTSSSIDHCVRARVRTHSSTHTDACNRQASMQYMWHTYCMCTTNSPQAMHQCETGATSKQHKRHWLRSSSDWSRSNSKSDSVCRNWSAAHNTRSILSRGNRRSRWSSPTHKHRSSFAPPALTGS